MISMRANGSERSKLTQSREVAPESSETTKLGGTSRSCKIGTSCKRVECTGEWTSLGGISMDRIDPGGYPWEGIPSSTYRESVEVVPGNECHPHRDQLVDRENQWPPNLMTA